MDRDREIVGKEEEERSGISVLVSVFNLPPPLSTRLLVLHTFSLSLTWTFLGSLSRKQMWNSIRTPLPPPRLG